jgi:hypothetical protein
MALSVAGMEVSMRDEVEGLLDSSRQHPRVQISLYLALTIYIVMCIAACTYKCVFISISGSVSSAHDHDMRGV